MISKKMSLHLRIAGLVFFLMALHSSYAQNFPLRGTVYDSSRVHPLEAVSVLTSSGHGTATNKNGQYEIMVSPKDSIWFSYLNKPTMKYPVSKITDYNQFDISLLVNIPVLKEVRVQPRNYKLDSIRNRIEYEKIFNFQRPNIGTMTSIGPNGAGIDIDELIRVFQFRKNRSTEKFQHRLLQQERDKFIDHRFNKTLVRRLTGLDNGELDNFMAEYRPSYEIALYTSDYDFQTYIKASFERYKLEKPRRTEGSKDNN